MCCCTFEDLQRVDRASQLAEGLAGRAAGRYVATVPVGVLHQGQRTLDAGAGVAAFRPAAG